MKRLNLSELVGKVFGKHTPKPGNWAYINQTDCKAGKTPKGQVCSAEVQATIPPKAMRITEL